MKDPVCRGRSAGLSRLTYHVSVPLKIFYTHTNNCPPLLDKKIIIKKSNCWCQLKIIDALFIKQFKQHHNSTLLSNGSNLIAIFRKTDQHGFTATLLLARREISFCTRILICNLENKLLTRKRWKVINELIEKMKITHNREFVHFPAKIYITTL